MTILDRICQLEARRTALLRLEWRDARALAELETISAELASLWPKRRMEMSGAAHQPLAEYRARKIGLSSVESKVTRSEGRRKEVNVS